MTADDWNSTHPIGTPVRYWPGWREGEGRPSLTRTPAWTLGSGTAVVSVEGYAGGIALTHVEPRCDDREAAECGAVSPHGDVCVRKVHVDGLCESVGRKRVSSPAQAGKPRRWYGTAPVSPVSGVPAGTPASTETIASRDSVRE